MKAIYIFSLLFFISCKTNSNDKVASNDKSAFETKKEFLQGIWAENEDENALFYIKKDSLYYLENQENPVPIKIKGDSLIIFGEVPAYCKILKLTNDSLWYIDEFSDKPTKLYKRKE